MDVNSFLQNFKKSAARERDADAGGTQTARTDRSMMAADRDALLSELSSSSCSEHEEDEPDGTETAGVRRVGRKAGLHHYDVAQSALAASSLEQRIANTELPSLRVYTNNEATPGRSGNVIAMPRRRLQPVLWQRHASRSQLYKRARAQAAEALRDELHREGARLRGSYDSAAEQTAALDHRSMSNDGDAVQSGRSAMLDVDELLSTVVPSARTHSSPVVHSATTTTDAATLATQRTDGDTASFAALLSSALLLPPVKVEESEVKMAVKKETTEEASVASSAPAQCASTEATQHDTPSAGNVAASSEAPHGKRKKTLFQRAKAIVRGDEPAVAQGDVLHVDRL